MEGLVGAGMKWVHVFVLVENGGLEWQALFYPSAKR